MAQVKLTLNKANKVKVDITKFLTGEITKRLTEVKEEYLFSKKDSTELDRISQRLLEMIKASKEKLDSELKLASDFQKALFNLKGAIFKANIESGLSDILLKISQNELENKYLSSLSSLEQAHYGETSTSSDKIDLTSRQISSIISRKEEVNGLDYTKVSVVPLTKKETESLLRNLKKQKDRLNDEKTRINNVTEITVDLEDGVIEYLGL
jgi:hypothetical protein